MFYIVLKLTSGQKLMSLLRIISPGKKSLEKQFFKYFFQFIVDNKMVYAT